MSMKSLVVIVLVVCPVFSGNLDSCTNLTKACPPAAQWPERAKIFDCPGNKRYICLMAPDNELRESCIFNYTIPAGQTGCPYTDQCDPETVQPALVLPEKYFPCPPDRTGCPPGNHSGYSILDIYKYPLCQKRNQFDKSFSKGSNTTTPSTKHTNIILQENIDEKSKFNADFEIRISLVLLTICLITEFIFLIQGRRLLKELEIQGRALVDLLETEVQILKYLELQARELIDLLKTEVQILKCLELQARELIDLLKTEETSNQEEEENKISEETSNQEEEENKISEETSNQEEEENKISEGTPLMEIIVSGY